MSKRTLQFGIDGLGSAGTGLLSALDGHAGFVITAAARRDVKALETFQQQYGAEIYASIDDLCKSPNVDAIYIATPTHTHTEHVLTAARHGKHVIVEKPMAISLEDADQMIEACARARTQLLVGHSHSYDPAFKQMRSLIGSGELGPLRMLHNWMYTDWVYRPRMPEELDPERGGGVTFRQGAHQIDIARLIGGGLVRSVRATTQDWDRTRSTVGAHSIFLEFENGTAATLVFSGYDRFRTEELTFNVGELGQAVDVRATHGQARRALRRHGGDAGEMEYKRSGWHGGARPRGSMDPEHHQSIYGLTVVSCERGDIRQSPDGLIIYADDEVRELPIETHPTGRHLMLQELYDAVVAGKPPLHDGTWGKATLEVTLAALQSSRERREIFLGHQVATKD